MRRAAGLALLILAVGRPVLAGCEAEPPPLAPAWLLDAPDLGTPCRWQAVLRPAQEDTAEPLATLPLCGEKPRLALGFRHSVSLTPVLDLLQVTAEGGLELVETRFVHHGAGLPSTLDELGADEWRQEDGVFLLTLRRALPNPMVMQVSRATLNRLAVPGETLDLACWGDRALALWLEPAARQRK